MKVLSLNTWAARAGREQLLDFFKRHKEVDVFCLQEIWEGGHDHASKWGGDMDTALLTNINGVLNEHSAFFRPHHYDWWGLATLIKKHLHVQAEGELFVHKEKEDAFEDEGVNHARNIQYVTLDMPQGLRTIVNFHGLWTGGGKEDNEDRLLQSDKIIHFLKTLSHPYVLCGDFNLLPDTESLKKFERLGMRNLIKENGIASTRSRHYTRTPHQFADYAFVSDGITVNDFKVLPDEVSDHLALYLDFE